MLSSATLVRFAAALAFLAVALGAFGAHALQPLLQSRNLVSVWEKATLYHFLHALALLSLGLARPTPLPTAPCWLFIAGIFLFSGSLYVLAITGIRWLGAITPLGGLCFLAGWLWLALKPPTV